MKFKNIKKEGKAKKSPSNSRSIPANFKFSFPKINHVILLKIYHTSLKIFIILVFIVAVVVVGFDFQRNLQAKQNIDIQRKALDKDLNFWESFTSKHQDYRDAYFQASILEYKLGDTSKARMYVQKGLSLDPNSEDGRKIEAFLNK